MRGAARDYRAWLAARRSEARPGGTAMRFADARMRALADVPLGRLCPAAIDGADLFLPDDWTTRPGDGPTGSLAEARAALARPRLRDHLVVATGRDGTEAIAVRLAAEPDVHLLRLLAALAGRRARRPPTAAAIDAAWTTWAAVAYRTAIEGRLRVDSTPIPDAALRRLFDRTRLDLGTGRRACPDDLDPDAVAAVTQAAAVFALGARPVGLIELDPDEPADLDALRRSHRAFQTGRALAGALHRLRDRGPGARSRGPHIDDVRFVPAFGDRYGMPRFAEIDVGGARWRCDLDRGSLEPCADGDARATACAVPAGDL